MNFSPDLLKIAERELGQNPKIQAEQRGCLARCEEGPNVEVAEAQTGETLEIRSRVMPMQMAQLSRSLLEERE